MHKSQLSFAQKSKTVNQLWRHMKLHVCIHQSTQSTANYIRDKSYSDRYVFASVAITISVKRSLFCRLVASNRSDLSLWSVSRKSVCCVFVCRCLYDLNRTEQEHRAVRRSCYLTPPTLLRCFSSCVKHLVINGMKWVLSCHRYTIYRRPVATTRWRSRELLTLLWLQKGWMWTAKAWWTWTCYIWSLTNTHIQTDTDGRTDR